MTNLRQRVTRIAREPLDAFKSALGIESPSRAYAGQRWDKFIIDGAPWPPSPPLPWYSARDTRDAYESPELRAAARRVRRLIRRHWFDLLYRPDEPTAMAVKKAMASPPKQSERPDFYQQMRDLLDAGKIKIDPSLAQDLAKEYGVRSDDET